MLSVVQRDLIEYAQFLIQKWTKVINDAHDQEFSSGEITMGGYGWRTKTGKEFTPAERRFELEMEGRGSLSHSASILVDQYNGLPKKEQEAFLLKVIDMHDQIIRETVKSPKKREAYFRELEEDDT